ncbi:MAG: hypothetical protein J2P29_03845, partial [Actinobacteria bacterium]|nr:hypothetical protein [Actinomycetota bacterium]
MRKVREPGWQGPSIEVLPGPAAVDPQLDDLAAYCRAVTGREEVAVAVAHDVLGAASSLLNDPHQLRAWLFANARVQMVGDATPGAQEIMDLVHQHGIRAQDLPLVLGVPPADANE